MRPERCRGEGRERFLPIARLICGAALLAACAANEGDSGAKKPGSLQPPAMMGAPMMIDAPNAIGGSGGADFGNPMSSSGGAATPALPTEPAAGGAPSMQPAQSSGPRNAKAILEGSCASAAVKTELLPTNVLFVLDRSASMLCNPPPTTESAACEDKPERADKD